MVKEVPINKGNYSLDTPEREETFNKHRALNVEEDYYKNRKEWEQFPKTFFVNDYPLLVDAELSSMCNLQCPFCFRSCEDYKNMNNSLMDFKLFKKIVDEISGKVFALRLSSRGEATLHPDFVEAIKYAKNKGIKEISSLTNGSKLTPKFFKECMDAGLDWLTISFDGLYEEYEKNRYPLKFDEVYNNLTQCKEIRDKAGNKKPVIKIQTIWPAIEKNPSEYYNMMSKVSDLLAFNPIVDYTHEKEITESDYLEDFSCPQIYQRVIIGANGIASMCTNDETNDYIVGDANYQTIYKIWHSDKINRIRNLHKEKQGFKKFSLCRKCYLPRKTYDCYSKVNNRDIIIRNYAL